MLNYFSPAHNQSAFPLPYSQVVKVGDLLFISGQIAEDPVTGEVFTGDIAEQTRRVMENLKRTLEQSGTGFNQTVMARLYLIDLNDYEAVNQVYVSYFLAHARPCRTMVAVVGLAHQAGIEIDLIAYCEQK